MEAIFLVCGAGGPQLKRNPLGRTQGADGGHTDAERAAITREFSRRRRYQILFTLPFVPLIFTAVGYQRGVFSTILGMPPRVGVVVFGAFVAGAGLFSLRNWRCPACSRYLGRWINPKHCPHCGITLRG